MKKLFALIVVCILVGGCTSTTFYHAEFPIIEKPDRPLLVNVSGLEMNKMSLEARQAVSGNFNYLIDYSRKLESSIDIYNEYALIKNQELVDLTEKTFFQKMIFWKD